MVIFYLKNNSKKTLRKIWNVIEKGSIFFILYYTFEALPDRIDFFLSSFTVLHLLLQFLQ